MTTTRQIAIRVALASALCASVTRPQSAAEHALEVVQHSLFEVDATVEWTGPQFADPDGQTVETPAHIRLSPDGEHIAWSAFRDARPLIGRDSDEHAAFDFGAAPHWSEDGSLLAFRVGRRVDASREAWTVLAHDGERWEERGSYDWIGELCLNHDGLIGFWEQPGARVQSSGIYSDQPMRLHVGARATELLEQASTAHPPVFGPKGKLCIAAARIRGRIMPFSFDGKRIKLLKGKLPSETELSMLVDVVLGPRGRRIACVVGDFDPTGGPTAAFGKRLIVDGETPESLRNRSCEAPAFGPKGRWLACTIHATGPQAGQRVARVDLRTGKSLEEDTWLEVRDFAWSAHGKHFAYAARSTEGWHLIVDERASAAFDLLGAPRFTGETVQLAARRGHRLLRMEAKV